MNDIGAHPVCVRTHAEGLRISKAIGSVVEELPIVPNDTLIVLPGTKCSKTHYLFHDDSGFGNSVVNNGVDNWEAGGWGHPNTGANNAIMHFVNFLGHAWKTGYTPAHGCSRNIIGRVWGWGEGGFISTYSMVYDGLGVFTGFFSIHVPTFRTQVAGEHYYDQIGQFFDLSVLRDHLCLCTGDRGDALGWVRHSDCQESGQKFYMMRSCTQRGRVAVVPVFTAARSL